MSDHLTINDALMNLIKKKVKSVRHNKFINMEKVPILWKTNGTVRKLGQMR